MTAIRESELNAELQRLLTQCEAQPSKEGYTSKELEKVWGLSRNKTSQMIDEGLSQGLISVERKPRQNRIGIVQITPVYVLVPQEKSKKRK